ncbi:MAG TPA: TIGR03118 family protein [Bryobacteraceae bacterium]|jgi:uncharacterized protein (TIGR03118 family)
MKTKILTLVLVGCGVQAAFGYAEGPLARKSGAPGDADCTVCHVGTALNGGPGSVTILLPNGATYVPGVKQHIMVQVADPLQQRWGFQLTARLNSDPQNGRAGDLSPTDGNTQIRCDSGGFGPCQAGEIQFIEHTVPGTRTGTKTGVTFEFDWTPPADGSAGSVTLYAAGNAANGNSADTGDHIYTTSIQLDPAPTAPVTTPALVVPATAYQITNLVSDIDGMAAQTDPNLVNPWGIALSPTSPFWIANNGSMTSTLYNGQGTLFPAASPLVVANVGAASGIVFNPTQGFAVQPGSPSSFIFATEDGWIIGWNGALDKGNGHVLVDNSSTGAVYKGLALGANASGPVLYAANFNKGTIDAFDANNNPLTVAGGFADPNLPAGFAPFNIYRLGQSLVVAYAMQDSEQHDDVAGPGNGYINVFDMNGNLLKRLVAGGSLNSPWGMALAPGFFGDFSGTLLVGNFGDGVVNAFDITTGTWVGALSDGNGNPLATPGLWGLIFGNGQGNGGDANTLYFTAGIAGGGSVEDHGLFGTITIAPPAPPPAASTVTAARKN